MEMDKNKLYEAIMKRYNDVKAKRDKEEREIIMRKIEAEIKRNKA